MHQSNKLAIAAILCLALPVRAADLPPDLALVPTDALAFAHVGVGEAYKSDNLKELRALLAKAGPEAMRKFSERFVPDPFDLDRVTAYALMPDGAREPMVTVIFRMIKPFDRDKLAKSIAPKGQVDGALIVSPENDIALRIIDNQTFQIGGARDLAKVLAWPARRDGPLAPALARAAGKTVFVAVNASAVPQEIMARVPAAAMPIAKLKLATLSVELGASAKIEARMSYPDTDAAADAEQIFRSLIEVGKGALVASRAELEKLLNGSGEPGTIQEFPLATAALVGLGAVRQYEDLLRDLPLKRDGNDVALLLDVPSGMQSNIVAVSAVGVGLLLPAVQKVREAAARSQSSNNLKQFALAMHNYSDAYQGNLPAHAIYSKDGKTPLLSWRVAILPYIEQDALYRQFKLDEPWDSEHNKKLIPMMPRTYMVPAGPAMNEPSMTYYQVFVGGGAIWNRSAVPPGMPRTFVDGTSNTIMIAEAGTPVIWTKPDDMEYDPKKPLPKMGNFWGGAGFLVALGDGSVRSIARTISEQTLRGAITAAGNETLGPDW